MRTLVALAFAAGLTALSTATLAQKAPSPGPVAGAGAVAEEEAAPTVDLARDLPFYDAGGRRLRPIVRIVPPPPLPPEPPPRITLGLIFGYDRLFVPRQNSEGTRYEALTYIGGRNVGFLLGAAMLGGQAGVSTGLSLLRFGKGVSLFQQNTFQISLLLPNLNIHVRYLFETDTKPGIFGPGLSTELVGVRVAGCLGDVAAHISVRGPALGGELLIVPGAMEFGASAGMRVDGGFIF